MKLCIKCRVERPHSEFHKDNLRKDGLFPYCKPCRCKTSARKGSRKSRIRHSSGYIKSYDPNHTLSDSSGYVYEHRKVLFDKFGYSLSECQSCGGEWGWDMIFYSHVDHIDENKANNILENLRPLCNSCNVSRSLVNFSQHTKKSTLAVTYFGETKTPQEWGRDCRTSVSGHTIRNRLKSGWSIGDALTRPKGNTGPKSSNEQLETMA